MQHDTAASTVERPSPQALRSHRPNHGRRRVAPIFGHWTITNQGGQCFGLRSRQKVRVR